MDVDYYDQSNITWVGDLSGNGVCYRIDWAAMAWDYSRKAEVYVGYEVVCRDD